jgi:uncharacterized membrane protein YccC
VSAEGALVQNPLRSEAAAFRFVGVTVVGAVLIFGAAKLNSWLGVAVAAVIVVGVGWWYWRQPSAKPRRLEVREEPDALHRVLVVANETVGGRPLLDEVRRLAASRPTEVLVVAPALNSKLRHWVSDEDDARAAAERRVSASVAQLATGGLTVRGEVGDAEPLQAIEDALRTFPADEIVISTHPEGRSHWLEQGLVAEADRRFSPPVTHVVVDLAADPSA